MNPDQFLKSLINYELRPGYNYDLDAYRKFLRHFSNPQLKIGATIHIAGTKGKGSIAAMIDSCLREAGYSVGLYTSPHLVRINERIRYNGVAISRKRLSDYLKSIRPFIKSTKAARTFFEVLTAIAFMYFRDRKCDFSVLEVGLGGRLDATNVARPMMTIISRIGYDHTDLLGKKLSQIACEKAGIIKPAIPVITITQRPSAYRVVASTARANASPLLNADRHIKIRVKKTSFKGTEIEITGCWGDFNARLPLLGLHQTENLKIALTALYECYKRGFHIDQRTLIRGIERTKLPGRFQILRKNPLIIFDCAHNTDSFKALHKNLVTFGLKNFLLIFGASKNKNIDYCIEKIFPLAQQIVLVPLNNPRSYTISELTAMTARFRSKITRAASAKKALDAALISKQRAPIIITGSFFLWPYVNNTMIK